MNKKVGMQYVKDFTFPAEQGFTGSAGKSSVKGYMRGGAVKGKTVGVTTKPGPKSKRTPSTMTKAAQGGSVHDSLYAAGEGMGYMRGGAVKNTSAEFVQTSGPQASMDNGVQPARKGRNQAEKEAGGTKRLKPKFKKGGGVHPVRSKARKGGLAKYAEGGSVSPPSVGLLGGGKAAGAARALREREERTKATVNEALAGQRKSQQASPRPKARVQDKPARAKPDRIYREDKQGVPTFTDVPKVGKPMGKRGAGR